MGTSSAYPGPGPGQQLLPSWAQGGPPEPPIPPPDPKKPTPPDGQQPPQSPPSTDTESPTIPPTTESVRQISFRWTAAKRAIGRASSGGGQKAFRKAGNAYVAAQGGSGRAAKSASGGRQASARLGGFLSGVSSSGLRSTLESFGATELIGQSLEAALAGIVDLIAPAASTLEDAITRTAITETLVEIFEAVDDGTGKLESLESLKTEDVRSAIEMSVANYIYSKWLQQLTLVVERKALPPSKAVKLERDVKRYVRDAVRLDLKGKDALRIDWQGKEGRDIISSIYEVAYSHLEVEK